MSEYASFDLKNVNTNGAIEAFVKWREREDQKALDDLAKQLADNASQG